jgi:hypothetical protein
MAGFNTELAWDMRLIREARRRTRPRSYRIGDFLNDEPSFRKTKHIPESISAKVHVSFVDGKMVRD